MSSSVRFALALCLLLGLGFLVGCDKLSFMPQAKKKVGGGYDAVKTGMSERQVVGLLGEPTRRRGIKLEGTGAAARVLTYSHGGHLTTVTLVEGAVVGKEKY